MKHTNNQTSQFQSSKTSLIICYRDKFLSSFNIMSKYTNTKMKSLGISIKTDWKAINILKCFFRRGEKAFATFNIGTVMFPPVIRVNQRFQHQYYIPCNFTTHTNPRSCSVQFFRSVICFNKYSALVLFID